MNKNTADTCVEKGIWTPIPVPPAIPSNFTLKLGDVDSSENDRIIQTGKMSFHMVGCTGDFSDHTYQTNVAKAMHAQLKDPAINASFFFHLGDVVYKPDEDDKKTAAKETVDLKKMYNAQFYKPYRHYQRSIFAIAGNHDGKNSTPKKSSAILHFLRNFCASQRKRSKDNETDDRPAMNQPYVYWRLDTPLAYIIGLYSNIANGGILDVPANAPKGPQYQWLVEQLKDVKNENASKKPRKAVLLAVHYPPYSGATNFEQRGDPTLGKSPGAKENAYPLGNLLQDAFIDSGQRPDAVFSAHAHLYQRLTYFYKNGWQVPYLIAGCGGHYTGDPNHPLERMWQTCIGDQGPKQTLPFQAVMPKGLALPSDDQVQVVAFNDQSFGFLRVTITSNKETGEPNTLIGEFYTADGGLPIPQDTFVLDLETHKIEG